jgi:hypothetical protein
MNQPAATPSMDSSGDTSGGGDTGSDEQGDGKMAVGDTATLSGQYYNDSYGGRPVGSHYIGVKNGVEIDKIKDPHGSG